MSILHITKAERKGAPVLIALYGESGSGKTYSALLLARGLAGSQGRIGLLDTETGRGLIYADEIPGGYEYAELTPPFTPERYIEAVKEFAASGVDVLVIDQASSEWEGIGGIIEIADQGISKKGEKLEGLVKWAQPKARHKKFVQALITTRMHIIVCLRAKEKIVQKGNQIVSEGFVSIQDKRFIFETTVQLFLRNGTDVRGTYVIEKCPLRLLDAFPDGQKITVATGERIAKWVGSAAQPLDHAFETLKRAGELAAEGGTKAFTAWWNSAEVKTSGREKLRPHLDNFKSIARAADQEEEAATPEPPPQEKPENPFEDPAPMEADAAPAGAGGSDAKPSGSVAPAAPPSPLGKGKEKTWPTWQAWAMAQLEAMPQADIHIFLHTHRAEFDYMAENRSTSWAIFNEAIERRSNPERASP